jgi:transposase-like protein
MHTRRSRYLRNRFPADIIGHAVWFYHRYGLSFRDVENLPAQYFQECVEGMVQEEGNRVADSRGSGYNYLARNGLAHGVLAF